MHKKEFRELICAMLLGDGCLYSSKARELSKKHKHPTLKLPDVFFAITHSSKQEDYALWKAELINTIFRNKNLLKRCTINRTKKIDKLTSKTYHGVYIKLRWAKYFRHLRKWIHKVDKGEVKKDVNYLLSQANLDIHTAIWFMDDGNEKRNKKKRKTGYRYDNPYYRLFTYSFNEGDQNLIKQWFKSKYDIEPKISFDKRRIKNGWFLTFSPKDSQKLFYRLSPYFSQIPSMKHKFRLSFERYASPQQVISQEDKDIVQLKYLDA